MIVMRIDDVKLAHDGSALREALTKNHQLGEWIDVFEKKERLYAGRRLQVVSASQVRPDLEESVLQRPIECVACGHKHRRAAVHFSGERIVWQRSW